MGSVIVATPTIARHFGADIPTVQWVVTAFALTISSLLLPMGRVADLLGRKRVYIAGFCVFAVGALFAGAAFDISYLIASRVVMGVGAGMMQGTSMAILLSYFSNEERGKALGMQLSVVGTGGVAGPVVGGLIVGAFGWRGVFFTTAMLAIIVVVIAVFALDGARTARPAGRRQFDWTGAMLSSAALVVFLLTVSNGATAGWTSPLVLAAFGGVAALVATFVWWELRADSPMLDVRLFSHKLFSIGVTASLISFVGQSSVRFLMPFYLQAVAGYSPSRIGFIVMPAAFAMIIMGPLGGRLSDRFGWTPFNVGGLALSATGLLILSRITEATPLYMIIGAMVIQSIGTGTFGAPNNSSILSTVEQSRYGVVSGFLNLVRNGANVTGIAIATAIVTAAMASRGHPPTLDAVEAGSGDLLGAFTAGLRTAYLVMGLLVACGAVLSAFKGTPPHTTRRP